MVSRQCLIVTQQSPSHVKFSYAAGHAAKYGGYSSWVAVEFASTSACITKKAPLRPVAACLQVAFIAEVFSDGVFWSGAPAPPLPRDPLSSAGKSPQPHFLAPPSPALLVLQVALSAELLFWWCLLSSWSGAPAAPLSRESRAPGSLCWRLPPVPCADHPGLHAGAVC